MNRACYRLVAVWIFASLVSVSTAHAQATASLRGTITDPSGAVVVNAKVELLQNGAVVTSSTTNAEGISFLS